MSGSSHAKCEHDYADKGNATVVLNSEDYETKAHFLLDDRESYSVLPKDPTRIIERSLLTLLRKLLKDNAIGQTFYETSRPSEGSGKQAMFYGRVKLQKYPSDQL